LMMMIIIIIVLSIGWEYVPELQPIVHPPGDIWT
jgi:hypothetical protein